MSTKLLLVDLDGVVLHRPGYFSKRTETLYPEGNHAAILEFFTGGTYKKVTHGERDLVEALTESLPAWQIEASVEEVLETWFSGENTIDQGVLDRIQEIRASGILCVLATDHSLYRKNQVWSELGMNKFFDGIIASADVGATKEETEFYTKAMDMLGVEDPRTVTFTDDDPKNVAVAESLGIRGIVFTGPASLDQIS